MRLYQDNSVVTPEQWLRFWGINTNDACGEKLFALVMLQHAIDDALLPPDGLDYQHKLDRASALAWFRGMPRGRFPFRLVCEALDIEPDWLRRRVRVQIAKGQRQRTVLTLNSLLSKLDGRKKSSSPSPTRAAAGSTQAVSRLRLAEQLQVLL